MALFDLDMMKKYTLAFLSVLRQHEKQSENR